MTLPSHILLGTVIGRMTGDYTTAIAVSAAIDIDHLRSYIKSGVLFDLDRLRKTVLDTEDPYGDQRGYLHNILIAIPITLLVYLISPTIGTVFGIAYGGHLLLDALDKSDYWPLYPYKGINIKGFVEYFSPTEIFFDIFLLIALIVLL